MSNFKIGDKVIGVTSIASYNGFTGTVVGDDGTEECNLLVDFEGWHGGHDGHGVAKLTHSVDGCYFVYDHHIEKIEEDIKVGIKVGDIVEVVNTGATYDTYKDWYDTHLADKGWFMNDASPDKERFYEVVAIAPHSLKYADSELIYGISDLSVDDPQVFIIGYYGINLVESKKEEIKEEVVMEFRVGDRVKGINGCIGNRIGIVRAIDEITCLVQFAEDFDGHNASGTHPELELSGMNSWNCMKGELKILSREVKIYEVGDFVKCIDITEENHERLIRGTVYTVAGVSVFDGNIVYAVKDSSGNLFHTMDRFEKVGQSDVEPEIGWIRCDVGVEGTEKKQMTCGAGFTALDFEPTNAERFYMVMDEMLTTYTAKNSDYGNSFEKTFEDYGMTSIAVRLSDKYLRLRQLTMTGMAEVKGESVRDTLLDMANYSIMAIMEMDKRVGVPVPSHGGK